jgi:hypothetical protein
VSDQGKRLHAVTFDAIKFIMKELEAKGCDDRLIDVEAQTVLSCAYAIICRVRGNTFDDIAPILREAFKMPTRVNSKGGDS